MKSRLEQSTKGIATFFSRAYKPGATKSQICEKMNGEAAISAASAVIFRLNMKPAMGWL